MSVLMRDYFQNPTIVRAGLLSVSLGHLTDLSLLLVHLFLQSKCLLSVHRRWKLNEICNFDSTYLMAK